MNTRIDYEDLVANAIIAKIEKCGERYVTKTEVNEYATACKNWFKQHMNLDITTSRQICMNLSEYTKWFVHTGSQIQLRGDKTSDELRANFRGYLNLDTLRCFVECGEVFDLSNRVDENGQQILRKTSKSSIDWDRRENRYILLKPKDKPANGMHVFSLNTQEEREALKQQLVPGTSLYLIQDGDVYIVNDINPVLKRLS